MVKFLDEPSSPNSRSEDSMTGSEQEKPVNGTSSNASNGGVRRGSGEGEGEGQKKKRKRRERKSKPNKARRHSLSKAARDPRDNPSPTGTQELAISRSPSPLIDFDGLSRPSKLSIQPHRSQIKIKSQR